MNKLFSLFFISSVLFCPNLYAQLKVATSATVDVREKRVCSSTSAEFIRDIEHPGLGEAYIDPNNVVWSSLLKTTNGKQKEFFAQDAAAQACREVGGRLPKKSEVEALLVSLGMNSPIGYSDVMADGQEILPEFSAVDIFLGDSPQQVRGFEYWTVFRASEMRRNLGYFRYRQVAILGNREAIGVRCVIGPDVAL